MSDDNSCVDRRSFPGGTVAAAAGIGISGLVAGACYARMDNQTRTLRLWNAGNRVSLAGPVFAPKSPTAREGEGYLLGVACHIDEALRPDLLILDAEHLEDGPIATVKLPVQASPQVHGWWVREDQFPS